MKKVSLFRNLIYLSEILKEDQAKAEKLNTWLKNAKETMLYGEMDHSEYKEIKAELEPEIERLRKAQTATNTLKDDYKIYGRKGLSIVKDLATIYASADLQRNNKFRVRYFLKRSFILKIIIEPKLNIHSSK